MKNIKTIKYFKYIGAKDVKEIYRVYPDDTWEYYNNTRAWHTLDRRNKLHWLYGNLWTNYYKQYSASITPITKAEAFIEIL